MAEFDYSFEASFESPQPSRVAEDWQIQAMTNMQRILQTQVPVYTPVYNPEKMGAPPSALPTKLMVNTMTHRVLLKWRENFGLSMTAHLLCHVMERPWADIRAELLAEYADGFFRVVDCPDIRDIAYYTDYPYPAKFDLNGKIHGFTSFLAFSDKQIKRYPPEQGYVNSWYGEGRKDYMFRDKALHSKYKDGKTSDALTPEQIIETLRTACHAK